MAAISHLSHLSPPPIDRPDSRVSLARSDTTYHSFQDLELSEPEAPSSPSQMSKPTVCPPPVSTREERPAAREMRRQDSGYASIARRDSDSSCRRTSSASLSSSTHQRRTKPPNQRTTKTGHSTHRPRNGRHSVSPPGTARSLPPQSQQQQQQPVTYFHFPHFTSSDPALDEPSQQQQQLLCDLQQHSPNTNATTYSLPPQTTHYWTSDRTRRLEYAAIDAASKGVRGWVMRHVVPDCFVPPSKRRIGFEDDRGSVVRYRLELESDEGVEKGEERGRGWRGWWFGMRRR